MTRSSKKAAYRALHAAVWISLAGTIVLFARTIDFPTLEAALWRARWTLVAAVVALNVLGALCRAGYWWVVLAPLGSFSVRDVVRLTFAGLAGNVLAPAHAGDAFKVWQLKRVFGIEVPVSIAAVALEKVGETFVLLLLVMPLPWLVPLLPEKAQVFLKLVPLGFAVAFGLVWFWVNRFARAQPSWLAGLSLLSSPRRFALGFGALLATWVLDLVQILLLLSALGLSGGLGAALLVLLIVNLAIAMPLTPGNAGTHELGSIAALALLGVPGADALLFALLYHVTQTVPLVLAGLPDLRALFAAKRWKEAET